MQASDQLHLSRPTIVLHWIVAIGVIGMLSFGLYISDLPRGPEKTANIQIHKSFGIILFFFVCIRVFWRLAQGWPSPVSSLTHIEKRLMRLVHWVLLVAPLVMIASGIAASLTYARAVKVFGIPFIPKLFDERHDALNTLAGNIHAVTAWCIIVALGLHVTGALYHHLVKHDQVLVRMLGGNRRTSA